MHWVIAYFICLASFLLIDGAFIGLFANRAYREKLGKLVNDKPKILPGVLLYTVYIAAILLYGDFALSHLLKNTWDFKAIWKTLLWGFGFGITTYGLYGLTALSLVKGWKRSIATIDILWGGVITSIVTLIGYSVIH